MNDQHSAAAPAQNDTDGRIAIVGLGACLPDAPNVATFWRNVLAGHVAIGEVPRDRWRAETYFDRDRSAMDRTYSRIGAFIRYAPFDPRRFRLVPRSLPAIDELQKLTLVAVAEALGQAGLRVLPRDEDGRDFDRERCATIFGNTMGGEAEDRTSLRVWLLEVEHALARSAVAAGRSPEEAARIVAELHDYYTPMLPRLTEDSMPGELSNCITGRIANVFDLRGANFTTDAACASTMAAVQAGVRGLLNHEFDTAVVGGADRSMDPPSYVKFCRIGALSPDRSTPFDEGANGFVQGEGVGVLVLKRYADAVAEGHEVLAVVRGIGASSDGRGKGLTAPNPRGQRLAVERAWLQSGHSIRDVGLVEAHGTSTAVGDACEAQVLTELLEEAGHDAGPVPLGSVKSMIGHLKSASGAASLIKATLALHDRVLPPSAGFVRAAASSPLHRGRLRVQTARADWPQGRGPRLVGVSSFGFGGTNFHVVLEEAPAAAGERAQRRSAPGTGVVGRPAAQNLAAAPTSTAAAAAPASPVARASGAALTAEVAAFYAAETGYGVDELHPDHHLEGDLGVDSVKQAEILAALRRRFGIGGEVQASLGELDTLSAIVAFLEAHRGAAAPAQGSAQTPTAAPSPASGAPTAGTGHPLSPATAAGNADDAGSPATPQPAWTGPEVLAFGGVDWPALLEGAHAVLEDAAGPAGFAALRRARAAAHGAPVRLAFVAADHSAARRALADAAARGPKGARLLGAKAIFVAEGEALARRGDTAFLFPGQGSQYLGMLEDLAARFPVVQATFAEADAVLEPLIGKALTPIVWPRGRSEAEELDLRRTEICQPAMLTADVAMSRLLGQFGLVPSVVAGHSLGEYAAAVVAGVLSFADALYAVSARGREMAGVKVDDPGRMAMVAADAAKVEAVLADIDGYVIAANKNCHTQTVIAGASDAVERALAAFAAQGLEARPIAVSHAFHSEIVAPAAAPLRRVLEGLDVRAPVLPLSSNVDAAFFPNAKDKIVERMARQLAAPVQFIDQVEQLWAHGARMFVEVGPKRAVTGFVRNILAGREHRALATNHPKKPGLQGVLETLAALTADGVAVAYDAPVDAAPAPWQGSATTLPTVGAGPAADGGALFGRPAPAVPKSAPAFEAVVVTGTAVLLPDADGVADWREDPYARLLAGHNFIRPVSADVRQQMADRNVVRLDKATGRFVPVQGPDEVVRHAASMPPLDLCAWGIDPALAEAMDVTAKLTVAAGIDALRDAGLPLVPHLRTTSTGSKLHDRWGLPAGVAEQTGVILGSAFPSLDAVLREARRAGEAFDRKWLFRALPMGHAQLAQAVLAQGPNTQVNAACASGTQALAMAADWIRLGRCERVLVVTADDVTQPAALSWVGAGFLAAGAASVEPDLARAAVPFGAERNGLILGCGAAAYVVESESAARARGIEPVAELLAGEFINSAFHGTRLDGPSIARFLEALVSRVDADARPAARRRLAKRCVFLSHETYTPARGGSAAAEVDGLRHVFGDAVSELTIANTKGFTGHPMGASFEDLVAMKGLQRQQLPPIANFHAPDPAFADLRFADGGAIDAEFALRFAAGFGSQVAACAYRRRARREARLVDARAFATWCAAHGVPAERGFEVHCRTLRLAPRDGRPLWALGIASLALAQVGAARPEQDAEAVSGAPAPAAAGAVPSLAPAAAAAGAHAPPAPTAPGARGGRTAVAEQPTAVRALTSTPAALLAELTATFAEATGYDPAELAPDHALEADLGIDSVKQAEILAEVRARYRVSPEVQVAAGEVDTLQALATWLGTYGRAPDRATAEAGPAVAQAPADAGPAPEAQEALNETALSGATPLPAPPSAAAAVSSRPAAAAPELAELLAQLTAFFAAQTGYDPAELAPDHALEADLGIDSVKQAEIFAQVRQRYGVADGEALPPGELGTLAALASWLHARLAAQPATAGGTRWVPADDVPSAVPAVRGDHAAAPPPAPRGEVELRAANVAAPDATPTSAPSTVRDFAAVLAQLTALFAEQTGYDAAELDPDHALEADLGIDSVKQAEIMASVRQNYAVDPARPLRLGDVPTLAALARWVCAAAPSSAEAEEVDTRAPSAPRQGLVPTPGADATTLAHASSARRRKGGATVDVQVAGAVATPRRSASSATAAMPAAKDAADPVATTRERPAGATAPVSPRDVLAELIALFARETGYDEADLEPEHALEADLGIDSVKQAELFAQVRAAYDLGNDPEFRLAEVQTLAAMADYVAKRRNRAKNAKADDVAPAGGGGRQTCGTPPPVDAAPRTPQAMVRGEVAARAVDLLPLPPPAAPAPDLATLGRCEVFGTEAAAVAEVARALEVRGCSVHERVLDAATPTGVPAAVDTAICVVTEGAPAACFARARAWAQAQRRPQRLLAVSRCGAAFGLARSLGLAVTPGDATQAMALAETSALLKALAKEWPQTRCLSVDALAVGGAAPPWAEAATLAAGALAAATAAWPYEEAVAVRRGTQVAWYSPARRPEAVVARPAPLPVGARVVATGGARGITYALLSALARRRPLDVVVLARTQAVAAADSVLHDLDGAAQRQFAKDALQRAGRRDTPAAVRAWIAAERVKTEVAENLAALRALGCTVQHIACDLSDAAARGRALQQLAGGPPVALLLHGAGYEESRRIEDKDANAWRRTAAPKREALSALVAALRPRRTVTMGSIAGRFGNGAQTDYAAANEALAAHARLHQDTALNLGWTAWAGIGMAERGSVRRVLEAGGIAMMPGEVGVALGAALIESQTCGDVVVAGPLGTMARAERTLPPLFTACIAGAEATAASGGEALAEADAPHFLLRRRFVPARAPGLDHHRIAGVPVLPGVMGVELMLQAARWASGTDNHYLRQVRFAAPVKFFRDEPLDVDVVVRPVADGLQLQVCTTFVGPDGRARRRLHFTAEAPRVAPPAPAWDPTPLHAFGATRALAPLPRREVYRRYFHGPTFQVLADGARLGDAGADAPAQAPEADWLSDVGNADFVGAPWLCEAGFQAAGLHEMAELARMSLPAGIDELWTTAPGDVSGNTEVLARFREADARGSVYDVALRCDGAPVGVMRGLRTVVLRPLQAQETFVAAGAGAGGGAGPERATLPLAAAEALLVPEAAGALDFYLSSAERQRLAQLRVVKRRIDWLAGRLAAKVALRRGWRPAAQCPAWSAFTVAADGQGEPEVLLAADAQRPEGGHPRLSLSHGDDVAVAVVSWDPDVAYGVDVERVAPRDPVFAQSYFTAAERAWAASGSEADLAYTTLWAIKEAASKALGIAGQVDLRALEVVPPPDGANHPFGLQLHGAAQKRAAQREVVVAAVQVETKGVRVLVQVMVRRRPNAARAAPRPKPTHDGEAASI